MQDRLLTPRFLIMFGYTFTVFTSVFQLLPTAPYHLLELGGSTAVAGLFHGFLTFSSALSGPFTGAMTDRIGHRPVLIGVSLLLCGFAVTYAFITDYRLLLALVTLHGIVWSALLAASGAYMTATIPSSRRAEGLSYWGLATVLAFGSAPALGFWVYHRGWATLCAEIAALNLLMAAIAWFLPDDRTTAMHGRDQAAATAPPLGLSAFVRAHVEWRVFLLSITTALVSFGYGALTSFSALFADSLGVAPRSLFLSALAVTTVLGRLTFGRGLDSTGPRRVFLRCVLFPSIALFMLAGAVGVKSLVAAGLVFGAGFGLMHPSFTSYVLEHVSANRRGAAFGAMLAAFDTGIGSGASLVGPAVQHFGFRAAFGGAAILAAFALPYFLFVERRLQFDRPRSR